MHSCQLIESVVPSSAGDTRFMYPLHCCEHQWLCTALPPSIGQKGSCQSKWDKMSKSSQFHLLCIYQTCSCSQQNWRSRDCSHSWEKGTVSLKESGPLSRPPGASQSLTNCSGLPCVPGSLLSQYGSSFCSHFLSFRSSSQALSYLCGSSTFTGSSICYYQHGAIQQTPVFSHDLAGDTRAY